MARHTAADVGVVRTHLNQLQAVLDAFGHSDVRALFTETGFLADRGSTEQRDVLWARYLDVRDRRRADIPLMNRVDAFVIHKTVGSYGGWHLGLTRPRLSPLLQGGEPKGPYAPSPAFCQFATAYGGAAICPSTIG